MDSIDFLVIGAGPAGLMAAIKAADEGLRVTILEAMPKPARKLGISGKGRGNLTNTAPYEAFLQHFNNQGRFLKSAFKTFFTTDLIRFLATEGLETVEERGGRVFVASGKATDAVNCLHKAIQKRRVRLITGCRAKRILVDDGRCLGVEGEDGQYLSAATLIATGGLSYPVTGSTGDGLRLAREIGHEIITPFPSLVPLTPDPPIHRSLKGLLLKNVRAELRCDGKKIADEFGEMAFLDGYLTGPILLTLSRKSVPLLTKNKKIEAVIDLKPALDHQKLDQRLLREFDRHRGEKLETVLKRLLPSALIGFCLNNTDLEAELPVSQIKAAERRTLRNWLKAVSFTIVGHAPWDQAIITAGGVSTKQINSSTMESKLIQNLYFAGEVIDIDADTGGFNLQAAFSTGYLAGLSAAKAVKS